jgi:octopine/nopaline transport system substrate-binding protein
MVLAVLGVGVARADDLIRFGTYRHYPPWTIGNPDGTITGFEIDLIHDLCRRMSVRCEISAVDWEHIFDALDAREFDIYVGAMTITPERAQRVLFSQPYALTPEYFATSVGSELTTLLTLNRLDLDHMDAEDQASLITLIEALRGKRVGVHVETVYETFAQQYLKGVADVRIYHTETEKYADMVHGKLDAILDSGAALHEFILARDTGGSELTLFGPALTGGLFGHGIGAALRRGNEALRTRLDDALAAAKADGTLARLTLTWFGYNAATE